MITRAWAAAVFAATVLSSPAYTQTMKQSVQHSAVNAAGRDRAERRSAAPREAGRGRHVVRAARPRSKVSTPTSRRGRLPGAVVAIVRKDKLVYFETFGYRDKAGGVPMTPDTIFNIASMTKPMARSPR